MVNHLMNFINENNSDFETVYKELGKYFKGNYIDLYTNAITLYNSVFSTTKDIVDIDFDKIDKLKQKILKENISWENKPPSPSIIPKNISQKEEEIIIITPEKKKKSITKEKIISPITSPVMSPERIEEEISPNIITPPEEQQSTKSLSPEKTIIISPEKELSSIKSQEKKISTIIDLIDETEKEEKLILEKNEKKILDLTEDKKIEKIINLTQEKQEEHEKTIKDYSQKINNLLGEPVVNCKKLKGLKWENNSCAPDSLYFALMILHKKWFHKVLIKPLLKNNDKSKLDEEKYKIKLKDLEEVKEKNNPVFRSNPKINNTGPCKMPPKSTFFFYLGKKFFEFYNYLNKDQDQTKQCKNLLTKNDIQNLKNLNGIDERCYIFLEATIEELTGIEFKTMDNVASILFYSLIFDPQYKIKISSFNENNKLENSKIETKNFFYQLVSLSNKLGKTSISLSEYLTFNLKSHKNEAYNMYEYNKPIQNQLFFIVSRADNNIKIEPEIELKGYNLHLSFMVVLVNGIHFITIFRCGNKWFKYDGMMENNIKELEGQNDFNSIETNFELVKNDSFYYNVYFYGYFNEKYLIK